MKKSHVTAILLILLSTLSSYSSDDEYDVSATYDVPDATAINLSNSSTNSLQQLANRTIPAFKAFASTTAFAAGKTAQVIVGAYSGAVAAVSEKPLPECSACRQRQAVSASKKVRSHSADSESDDEIDRYDYTNVSHSRPVDIITQELENKAKIKSLEKADLFQRINDCIKQTYTQDAHRLSEEIIQQRINRLIVTSQEESDLSSGQDVSISKQTALFYVQKQLNVLDRQLRSSSQTEETAQITRDGNIKLAESQRAHEIEKIEKQFLKRKTKEEKKYNKTLAQEFHLGSLLASNARHLLKRSEKEVPLIAQADHYQTADNFQKLLTSLRPQIEIAASEVSSGAKGSKKK